MINSIVPSNQFVVLGSSEDKLEEGEIQHLEGFVVENKVSVTMDQVGPDFLSPKGVGEVSLAPVGPSSSPSYDEIAGKNQLRVLLLLMKIPLINSPKNLVESLRNKFGKKRLRGSRLKETSPPLKCLMDEIREPGLQRE